jgi:hypothetical protein
MLTGMLTMTPRASIFSHHTENVNVSFFVITTTYPGTVLLITKVQYSTCRTYTFLALIRWLLVVPLLLGVGVAGAAERLIIIYSYSSKT